MGTGTLGATSSDPLRPILAGRNVHSRTLFHGIDERFVRPLNIGGGAMRSVPFPSDGCQSLRDWADVASLKAFPE